MAFSFALFSLLFCSLPLPMNAQSPPSAFRTEDSASTSSSQQEQRETSERPHGTFSLDGFAHALRIEKDLQDPSRLLNVFLPPQSFGHFRQFIARVTDISRVEEQRWRDANRTFLASLADSSVINVHGLSPGHKYSVAILGRKEAESTLIREDQVLMDPMPLELGVPGNSSAIVATSTNITMRAQKPERALQDTFRVEYHQLDPLKRFPILDVHDIQEQREVELYLGNLSPGRDYAIAVTSLRDELPSQQWRGIVTTRPLRPVSLSVAEVNASCVQFSWVLPPESGADRFKVAYGMLHGPNSMQKLEMVYPAQQAELCQHIVPGRVFIFAVITEKSRQISEPATISHTVRPLPPRELSVEPDFEKARFRVRVHLPSDAESHTEKCQIWVEPEQGGRAEQTVPAQQRGAQHQCEALFELSPGRRYEISATALSEQAASTRVLRNRAVEPGFDFGAFGLTLKEDDAALRLEWPQSEVARLRIADLWARIVGRDSHLHFAVQPLDSDAAPVQMETGPTEPEPVLVEAVRGGDCYKVLLYTVTASGIVSEQRFEQHIRTAAPQLTLTVGQLGPRSATLQAFLFRPKEKRVPALPLALSPQCQLHVVVADALSGELVLERTLALSDPQHKSPSLEVDGLRPWHKYAANAQVNCGSVSHSPCAPKVHRVPRVEFRTESAHPGPIGNLSARPLNPYSAQLRWLAPEEPNGRIHSYIVQIAPLREQEESDGEHQQHSSGSGDSYRPWTESVPAAGAELAADGSESVLPRAEVDKVLDGLAGGRRYRVQVWAVNEAGQADSSGGAVELRTPIAAPPRPAHSVEVLPESVHGHSLRVRFDTDQLSERNGRLTQMALIVAEAGESGGLDEEGEEEGAAEEGQLTNGTQMPTWAMARRVPGRWPPFVALQETLEGRRFGRKAVWTESVGTAQDCEQRSAAQLCNGPLKAGAVYRLKLRLFTAPHLWTDSPLSEPVHMEPPSSDAQFGVLLVALFLLLIAALAVTAAAVFVCWRRRATHQKRRKHSSLGSKFCPAKFPPRRSHHSADNHSTTTAADSCPSPPPDPRQQQRQRESQWAALKMMMAERAADCLAKLGLDAAAAASHDKADSSTAKMVISSPQQRQGQQHNNVLCGGNSAPCSSLFGAPHHRRSKSLRERTGVDQRLERLQPSGIAPGSRHSTLPWTVIRGPNIQPERNRPIQIGDFIEHVRLMSADSDFRFSEEYEDLRTVGLGQSCIAADMTANRAKNRFTNILPYDHSRVKLKPTDDEDGSDYVNASYIPGFNSRREFIAAQGPLPSTRDHFWRLVWEQQVPAVVALTKCVEKGRDKCHQYWPDNSQRSVLHADIEVTLLTESIEYEEFTIRELRLTNLAEPSQPARTVQHLHYQAWPDFGVPDHPAGIVHFARLFRNKLNPSPANKPTIVHCSAGVGRSGTFIALDRLVQHIESGKPIDVFGTVYEMRLERCHMVQNEQQYIFIHHCLQYVLENFYPFLVSQQQQQAYPNVANRPVSSPNTHLPFGTSISSPIGGGGNYATSPTTMTRDLGGQWATTTKGFANNNNNGAAFPWATSAQQQPYVPPKIEVHHHQNDGFLEDDEGIAESGL